jgi:hypothetical protein
MNKILLLTSILFGLTISSILAQQPWRFHIAFEDGTGQRDTLWMVFDNSATGGIDYQLGEGTTQFDSTEFNVFMLSFDTIYTKVRAYPYSMYPYMTTGSIYSINYSYPVIIRWDTALFHAPYLPTSPPMNYAIVLGDYQFAVFGIDTTSPYLHNVFMFSKDSLFCPEDTSGPNTIPLFGFGCLGFRLGYDAYLSINKETVHSISSFPNPVLGKISFTGNEYIKLYAIYNIQGSKLFEKRLASVIPISQLTIDASDLPSGIYIIKLITQLNKTHHEKIIINH